MSDSRSFELLSTGSEFETAGEEFERGGRRQAGATRYRAPRPGRLPPRPKRPFRPVPRRPWGAAPAGWPAGWDVPPVAPGPEYQRCMQDCLRSATAPPSAARSRASDPEPGNDTVADPGADANADGGPPEEETMHKLTCQCPQCTRGATGFEVMEFAAPAASGGGGFGAREAGAYEGEGEGESQYEGPYESEGEYEGEAGWSGEAEGLFSEAEEIALAAELLSISNEAELEQFLGKLWQGVKKAGSFIGKVAKPFAGVLKAVAKKALPFVGGALGSLIPIPGVGTAVGSALGGALSKALEMEFGEMELEDREFEMARSFVRIAGTAAQQLGQSAPGGNPQAAVEKALAAAAQQHLRHFQPHTPRDAAPRMSGRWIRRGGSVIIVGA